MFPWKKFLGGRSELKANLKKMFEIRAKVDTPVLVGKDEIAGRRQLIPIISGELIGENMSGTILPGGVDSQVIRPNGKCELSARYGVKLDDGTSFYVENNGIRTVPKEYVDIVKEGGFIDPSLYYFCTNPHFEVYSEKLNWLTERVFICTATRLPDEVLLDYYVVEA